MATQNQSRDYSRNYAKGNLDMRVSVLASLLMVVDIAFAQGGFKDPRERDDDISSTEVSVSVAVTDDGLYEYSYEVDAGGENKGLVTAFTVDLECTAEFDDHELPDPESSPYSFGVLSPGEPPPYTPSVVYFGESAPHGISVDRSALWTVGLRPGQSIDGMRIISPAKPGMREYQLVPATPTSNYDFESLPDGVTENDLPQTRDFIVTGLIEGPECPGITSLRNSPRFQGTPSGRRGDREHFNSLLSYSAPLHDRMTVSSDQESLPVTIHYHERLESDTFRVEPGHLRSLFIPEPGSSETVALPLEAAVNEFQLEARGSSSAGPAVRDEDLFEVRLRRAGDDASGE